MSNENHEALMQALRGVKTNARRARIAKRLPEGQRPREFMIQIGMLPPDAALSEDETTEAEAGPTSASDCDGDEDEALLAE